MGGRALGFRVGQRRWLSGERGGEKKLAGELGCEPGTENPNRTQPNPTEPNQPNRTQPTPHQVERNLHDAMGVARNITLSPALVPGGGAVEMAVSRALAGACACFLRGDVLGGMLGEG